MARFGSSSSDPLQLPATPHRIRTAATAAGLPPGAIARAGEIAAESPDAASWTAFLSRMLALLGAGLLLAGVVCAVAYNWARIGRFGKFALIEAVIVIAAVAGWRLLPRFSGQLALLAAAVLIGPLLGVYGQAYQTGADPYGLFLTWALLIVPWVIVARFSLLWILLVGLLDLTMMLWWSQVVATKALPTLLLAIAALHGLALIAWEWQYRRSGSWLVEMWAAHVLALGAFVALTVGSAVFIIADLRAGAPGVACVVLLVASIAAALQQYRQVRPDPLMVTIAGIAGLVTLAVVAGRILFGIMDLGVSGPFLMALFMIAEITFGVRWFRRAQHGARGAEG